jgi:hypothetical protein
MCVSTVTHTYRKDQEEDEMKEIEKIMSELGLNKTGRRGLYENRHLLPEPYKSMAKGVLEGSRPLPDGERVKAKTPRPCKSCAAWCQGRCRASHPAHIGESERAVWPKTDGDEWCLEWRKQ